MNLLTALKLKSGNDYTVVSSLWKDEEKTIPIIDTEGEAVLLQSDGTSWIYSNGTDGCWEQIDTDIDMQIVNSIYPFIMSVNNSIYNDFVNCCCSKFYNDVSVTKNADEDYLLDIKLGETPCVQEDDYIYIVACHNKYLTKVISVDGDTITVDNRGLNMRFKPTADNYIGVLFVSFPPDYLQAVIDMFAFDLFKREDKEKRQERLGNYTYTNFEPVAYYGSGSYPKEMQDAIQYWQYIHV